MSKKAQRLKAAQVRATRWPTSRVTATPKDGPESAVHYYAEVMPEWLKGDTDNDMAMHLTPADHAKPRYMLMKLDLECDSNCGYTGGVSAGPVAATMKCHQILRAVGWILRMEAYWSGLRTKDTQLQVKKFSSTKYKSHRHVLETITHLFD
ncbi:hypothetical protein SERLA73DRAFT_68592 [Serpula lacrymans var. lacrymans S7.3]|uniref:Uncharacterized protein n=2 Tax=Serpula lacrymans var. lacrymans TaxID=341189 RepID=F8PH41_SERL3|nr:uncharacterized protein SERLADRAFT_432357 [Serpula lacrymans var. lacrymans S7.9]EGO04937.1 hypothetical protein SERLA73DRAFT_68592 [Serpula lacrymans var. lacrymans S7.3]EGO30739.1 hypothetical protein SERLADRAFT_432357 [Serpula lacrymans var. lacrymans S7.9]